MLFFNRFIGRHGRKQTTQELSVFIVYTRIDGERNVEKLNIGYKNRFIGYFIDFYKKKNKGKTKFSKKYIYTYIPLLDVSLGPFIGNKFQQVKGTTTE